MTHKAACVAVAVASLTALAAGPTDAKTFRRDGSVVVASITPAPGHQHILSAGRLNVVYVHPGLTFSVALRNDAIPRKTRVTLTITRRRSSTGPIVKNKTIALAANARTRVRFAQLGTPLFAQRETLKLAVIDQSHREKWVTTYPIIFALG